MESKFKVGDKCRIVRFGHLVWESKKSPIYKSSFPTYSEGENIRFIDISPEKIGKEVVITEVRENRRCATNLFSLASEHQLELIEN